MKLQLSPRERYHPEAGLGEIFLCNVTEAGFQSFPYLTKRRGQTAYTIWGDNFFDLRPMFVQRSELIGAGILIKGGRNMICDDCKFNPTGEGCAHEEADEMDVQETNKCEYFARAGQCEKHPQFSENACPACAYEGS